LVYTYYDGFTFTRNNSDSSPRRAADR